MKVLLDIKDDKAPFVMVLLKSFSFVKVKPLTFKKAQLVSELREAIEDLNPVPQG